MTLKGWFALFAGALLVAPLLGSASLAEEAGEIAGGLQRDDVPTHVRKSRRTWQEAIKNYVRQYG